MAGSCGQGPKCTLTQTLDEGRVLVNTEAKTQPPPAAIDADLICREAAFRGFGVGEIESAKITARQVGRRNQGTDRQQTQVGARNDVEKLLLQLPRMPVNALRGHAEILQPAHDRVESIQAGRVESRTPEAERFFAISNLR